MKRHALCLKDRFACCLRTNTASPVPIKIFTLSLANHLKDPDFFDVETFPVSIFKIDSPQRISMHDWNINGTLLFGDLTIKDISHSTTIPMTLTIQGNKAKATGIIKIDRTLFGIIYGSCTFYDNLADKAIDDEFYIKFNVVGYIQ